MKILVCVKRVVDFKATIRIKSDASDVDTANAKMSMNPFDEIAVEEAVRIKEKGLADEIIALSIGNEACQETLRTALAMGADQAILIKTDDVILPLSAAKIIKAIAVQESVDLIILGKQAIDTDDNQTGQMVAGLLNWAQGTFASKLEFQDQGLRIVREIDGGLETLFLNLPAVITTDLRLNEPRYISLPNIVKAKQKSIRIIPANELNIHFTSTLKLLSVAIPEKKRKSILLTNAQELVDRLKNEAQVIG